MPTNTLDGAGNWKEVTNEWISYCIEEEGHSTFHHSGRWENISDRNFPANHPDSDIQLRHLHGTFDLSEWWTHPRNLQWPWFLGTGNEHLHRPKSTKTGSASACWIHFDPSRTGSLAFKSGHFYTSNEDTCNVHSKLCILQFCNISDRITERDPVRHYSDTLMSVWLPETIKSLINPTMVHVKGQLTKIAISRPAGLAV